MPVHSGFGCFSALEGRSPDQGGVAGEICRVVSRLEAHQKPASKNELFEVQIPGNLSAP
jgi:hypothetical protein